eukprot:scaffold978_cov426-Pavlova_lutheri.AAC.2
MSTDGSADRLAEAGRARGMDGGFVSLTRGCALRRSADGSLRRLGSVRVRCRGRSGTYWRGHCP